MPVSVAEASMEGQEVPAGGARWRRWGVFAVCAAILAGAAFRLAWVEDMEYKADEQWMFERACRAGVSEPFPWLGPPSGSGVRHSGSIVWAFIGLGRLFHVQEPTDLGRLVQVLNVAALLLLLLFAFRWVPAGDREQWLWAAALVAVNPLAVLMQRKIWNPSITPCFSVLMLMGWWRRDRHLGAFFWGLFGVVLGYLHPAGLFMTAGFGLWAFLFDRKGTRWLAWLAGCALASLPQLPWLSYLAFGDKPPSVHQAWHYILTARFWTRWTTEPLGDTLRYTLDAEQFANFLRGPVVAGHHTWLVGALHGVLMAAAVAVLLMGARRLWLRRARWWDLFVGRESPTAFTQSAALWGFGILFTLTCLAIYRHYMTVAFPLTFVWATRMALGGRGSGPAELARGRVVLLMLCGAQALITAGFLNYVHTNPRYLGEYGVPYAAQAHQPSQAAVTGPGGAR
jgi:hypothetical protein